MAPLPICWTCKRKFASPEAMQKHIEMSEIHSSNATKEIEDISLRRDTLRHAIIEARNEIKTMDSALEQTVLPQQDLLQKKTDLMRQGKMYEREYGFCQERLEVHREKQQRCAVTSEKPIEIGPFELTAGVCTWQGNKEMQEDRFCLDRKLTGPNKEPIIAYAVFDGHSGGLCADYLVETFFPNLQKVLSTKKAMTEELFKTAVTETCCLTDDDFLNRAKAHLQLDGTTAIINFIWMSSEGPRLLIANVGDSRTVLTQGKGLANVASEDHKPCRPDERRRIEGRGGVVQDMVGVSRVFTPTALRLNNRYVQWGLAVSRAFGDLPLKHPKHFGGPAHITDLVSSAPEITCHALTPGKDQLMILACDGIWDVMENDEAAAVAHIHFSCKKQTLGSPVLQAARGLVRDSFQRGSDDNLTALVVHLGVNPNHVDEHPAKRRRK